MNSQAQPEQDGNRKAELEKKFVGKTYKGSNVDGEPVDGEIKEVSPILGPVGRKPDIDGYNLFIRMEDGSSREIAVANLDEEKVVQNE